MNSRNLVGALVAVLLTAALLHGAFGLLIFNARTILTFINEYRYVLFIVLTLVISFALFLLMDSRTGVKAHVAKSRIAGH